MVKTRSVALCGALCAAALLLAGCTSLESKLDQRPRVGDGVVYYMPKQPIRVSVTIDKNGHGVPSVSAGEAVPDLSHRFLLYYRENFVGTNHMNIAVNAKGLLTSSVSDTTSGVATIAKNLATAAGQVSATGFRATQEQPRSQCPPGVYTMLFFPETDKQGSFCSFAVTIAPAGGWTPAEAGQNTRSLEAGARSGIFYKHDLAYRVSVADEASKAETEFIAFSPDESPISFVPVTRTLFADNHANLTLQDGILTNFDQTSTGEIVALSSLPAEMISAYFQAVGSMFNTLGSNTKAHTALLSAQQDLAVEKIKSQNCQAAIAANKAEGKTEAELQQALAGITAACGG